ncbi:MAG: hypothetical protein RIE73_15310 [Coleofasciculus sp. C1-SOL-03]|jgi:hypothetical protein|uniref:hypothetical protein n=1 Tax=Coleofasciculus sp. C1-SOL-03 TaxID=3069522 RepID=UPI0032FEC1A0
MSRLLITQYQAEVEKIIRYGGSRKETSIRNAFERLLNDYTQRSYHPRKIQYLQVCRLQRTGD